MGASQPSSRHHKVLNKYTHTRTCTCACPYGEASTRHGLRQPGSHCLLSACPRHAPGFKADILSSQFIFRVSISSIKHHIYLHTGVCRHVLRRRRSCAHSGCFWQPQRGLQRFNATTEGNRTSRACSAHQGAPHGRRRRAPQQCCGSCSCRYDCPLPDSSCHKCL